jgi:predicted transposase YdaD
LIGQWPVDARKQADQSALGAVNRPLRSFVNKRFIPPRADTPSTAHIRYATLLSLIYLLAELVCENDEDLLWLDRRFAMLYDVLQESKAYQRIKQEGREEGELQALHRTVLTVVQARFPEIVQLATKRTAEIHDAAALETLILNLSLAQTLEEAGQYILALDEEQES